MRLVSCTFKNYRSIRSVECDVSPGVTGFLGPNGVGKSNLYKALEILHHAAVGQLSVEIAKQGGIQSAIWAGSYRKSGPNAIEISADVEDEGQRLVYDLCIGIPYSIPGPHDTRLPGTGIFPREVEVKSESVTLVANRRRVVLMTRKGASLGYRDETGRWSESSRRLLPSETALSALDENEKYPECFRLKRLFAGWRFYHAIRTDPDSPLRCTCPAVSSTSMLSDGSNLAAVLATLKYVKEDIADLESLFESAFDGQRLIIPIPDVDASFYISSEAHDNRLFSQVEISDGTLRFIALLGVLFPYRAPPLIALNEPESSLHNRLLPVLAEAISRASQHTQIWLVTHSEELVDRLRLAKNVTLFDVSKGTDSSTVISVCS